MITHISHKQCELDAFFQVGFRQIFYLNTMFLANIWSVLCFTVTISQVFLSWGHNEDCFWSAHNDLPIKPFFFIIFFFINVLVNVKFAYSVSMIIAKIFREVVLQEQGWWRLINSISATCWAIWMSSAIVSCFCGPITFENLNELKYYLLKC